jgi:hypothetical protein
MEDKNLVLYSAAHADLRLRAINKSDIENLRTWKNRFKSTCFLSEDISPQQQENWYTSFSTRQGDFMFVVEQEVMREWKGIGCMGFRRLENEGCMDAYNMIRANKIKPASFTMGDAFSLMLTYANTIGGNLPIQSKCLQSNPALTWYQRNNFTIVRTSNNYYLMELNKESLKVSDLIIKNN